MTFVAFLSSFFSSAYLAAQSCLGCLSSDVKAFPTPVPIIKNVENTFFTHDDLAALKNQAIGGCAASESYLCIQSHQRAVFRDADLMFRSNPEASLFTPFHPSQNFSMSHVLDQALIRGVSRYGLHVMRQFSLLRIVLDGRIDVDISFEQIRSLGSEQAQEPSYVYVLQKKNQIPSEDSGKIRSSTLINSEKLDEIKVIELIHKDPAPSNPQVSRAQGFGERLARFVGVTRAPFGYYRLRLERPGGAFAGDFPKIEHFRLQLEELNGLAVFDLSQVFNKNIDKVPFSLRVPFHRHSLTFSYSHLAASPIRTYAYVLDDQNRFLAQFDPHARSYTAQFVRQVNLQID